MFHSGKTLECPFTWNIDETMSHRFEEDKELITSVKDQPVIALMNELIDLYKTTVKEDYEEAKRKINEVRTLYKSIDTRRLALENISRDALKHVAYSTLYHAYDITGGNDSTAQRAFERLTDASQFTSEVELATLHGCRSIVASSLRNDEEALSHARQAVSYCADCPLWHLLLHRALRGSEAFEERQNARNAIVEYTERSNEPYYLVHAAQIHRDAGNSRGCAAMYARAYEVRPEGTEVLLRLALGFVRARKLKLAGNCLEKLEARCRDNTMFLHYKGNHLEALGCDKLAAQYYEAAARSGNYGADFQYILCRRKFDRRFDVVRHLQVMIIKYSDKHYTQLTLLHLAMQYERRGELEEACEHFIKAIRLDKQSYQLKKFRNRLVTRDKKRLNILHYVKYEFVPKCDHLNYDIVRQLRDLCD